MTDVNITGHLLIRGPKSRPVFHMKYRTADGRQVMKRIGPQWTDRSRPPAGYYTKRTAEELLQATLSDARRGTLTGPQERSGRTFGDACAGLAALHRARPPARPVNAQRLPQRHERESAPGVRSRQAA
jgi:hypothetical protein